MSKSFFRNGKIYQQISSRISKNELLALIERIKLGKISLFVAREEPDTHKDGYELTNSESD